MPSLPTVAEIEEWCAANGYTPGFLYWDPACKLIRGTCTADDDPPPVPQG